MTRVRQRQRGGSWWGPRGTGRPLTGGAEGGRGPEVRPQALNQHLPPAWHCPSWWQQRKRQHGQSVFFHRGDVLNGNRKQSWFKIHQDFRLWGWRREAIFTERGTPREVARKSLSEMVALVTHLNGELKKKHSRQDILPEATTDSAFLRTRKAALWPAHTGGGRAGWRGLAAAAAAFY